MYATLCAHRMEMQKEERRWCLQDAEFVRYKLLLHCCHILNWHFLPCIPLREINVSIRVELKCNPVNAHRFNILN